MDLPEKIDIVVKLSYDLGKICFTEPVAEILNLRNIIQIS